MSGTEQRGVCAGGKKPTARSINRILKLFESFKIRTAGRKYFFDTLKGQPPGWPFFDAMPAACGTGGDTPRPYEKSGSVIVGAAFMAARGSIGDQPLQGAPGFSVPERRDCDLLFPPGEVYSLQEAMG